MMTKKYFEMKKAELNSTINEVVRDLEDGNYTNLNSYFANGRGDINQIIIEIALGADIKENNKNPGEFITRFNHGIPSNAQVAEIRTIINNFHYTESIFISSLPNQEDANDNDDDDDMAIPSNPAVTYYSAGTSVSNDMKLSAKQYMEQIVLSKDKSILLNTIDANDFDTLVEVGRTFRRKRNIKLAIIAGSIIAIGTGVAFGCAMAKKNSTDVVVDNDNVDDDVDDGIIDLPDEDDDLDLPEAGDDGIIDLPDED